MEVEVDAEAGVKVRVGVRVRLRVRVGAEDTPDRQNYNDHSFPQLWMISGQLHMEEYRETSTPGEMLPESWTVWFARSCPH